MLKSESENIVRWHRKHKIEGVRNILLKLHDQQPQITSSNCTRSFHFTKDYLPNFIRYSSDTVSALGSKLRKD